MVFANLHGSTYVSLSQSAIGQTRVDYAWLDVDNVDVWILGCHEFEDSIARRLGNRIGCGARHSHVGHACVDGSIGACWGS